MNCRKITLNSEVEIRKMFLLTMQKNERFGSAYFRVGVGYFPYLTNIKHFPCSYTVISTRVEILKTRNCVEMPKSARYHIDRAEIVVLPQKVTTKGYHNSPFHPRRIVSICLGLLRFIWV